MLYNNHRQIRTMPGVQVTLASFISLLFLKAVCSNGLHLNSSRIDVFENDSATLSFDFPPTRNNSLYDELYFFDNSNYGSELGSVNYSTRTQNRSCFPERGLEDDTIYKVICNATSVSIIILHVSLDRHNQVWQMAFVNVQEPIYTLYLYVNVRVKHVVLATRITENENLILTVNSSTVIEFMCASSFCRPNATTSLRNTITDQIIFNQSSASEIRYLSNSDLWQTNVTFRIVAETYLNGENVSCSSTNDHNRTVHSHSLLLNVQYPPEGQPSICDLHNASVYDVIENNTGNLTCSISKSNPPAQLMWICMNITSAENQTINSSVLKWTVTRHNFRMCSCQSTHILSERRTVSVLINVLYPPEFIGVTIYTPNNNMTTNSTSIDVIENTQLTFVCSAKGNPDHINYTWSGLNISNNAEVKVVPIKGNSGNLNCSASNRMKEYPHRYDEIGTNNKTLFINVLFAPTINFSYINRSLIEGKPFSMSFNITPGNPVNLTIQWTPRYGELTANNTYIFIRNVTRKHQGWLTGSVNNTMRTTYESINTFGYTNKSFYINVLFPPENFSVTCFVGISRNEHVDDRFSIIEGINLTLLCNADSNPSPSYYSWGGVMVTESYNLTFMIKRNHTGDYICSATNKMTEIPGFTKIQTNNKTYHIIVLYPPDVEMMKNMTVLEGEHLQITCPFKAGIPSNTSFKWTRTNDNRLWRTQTLSISNVSRSDTSTYTCEANNTLSPTYGTNMIGSTSKTVHIEILYKASIKEFFVMKHGQTSATVNEFDNVTLTCSVESNPKSDLRIFFKESLLKEHQETRDLTMQLKAECTNRGNYSCHGNNSFNNVHDIPFSFVTLYVNCSPRQLSTAYPSNNVTNVTSVRNVSCTLTFNAIAYPIPDVQWYRKNDTSWTKFESDSREKVLISSSADELQYNLTLFTISETDYGQYRIDVNNSFGRHTQLFNLNPKDIPNPPNRFGIYEQNVTETSVDLWWEPGFDGGLPQTFLISYREDNSHLYMQMSLKDTHEVNMTVTINGLKSATKYHFMINATNDLGSVRYVDEITITTKAPVKKPENLSIVGPVAGGTIGGVLAVVVIALALLFVRKRRIEKMAQEDKGPHEYQNMSFIKDDKQQKRRPPLPNEDLHDIHDRQTQHVPETHPDKDTTKFNLLQKSKEAKQHPVYENMNLTEDAKQSKRFKPDPIEDGRQMLYYNKEDVSDDPETRKSKMQQKPKEVKHHPEYENMNLTEDAKHRTRLPPIPTDDAYEVPDQQNQLYDVKDAEDHQTLELLEINNKISLSDLLSYVTSKPSEDYVHEYTRFPLGIIDSISYSFARKPQNAPLNRYQGIYPYDHSRVVIPAEPDFFINANYIDGYSKKKAYIASLGPTVRHTLGFQTFWKMVWHEKSDVIVMLTNLQEPSGMKCEKYWADYETTREVGDFIIQSVTEEIAAEYTVRTFNVSKKGESRSVTQLHYTAWPDKKVPEDVTSLIEFWQRVKAAPTRSLGPLVVHCSAGIGRTGTYIALDRLFEEGKTTDSVNVFDCVMSMRQQRVNMVQTQDQYVYLHQALVYCLVFDTEPVTAENIEEYVKTTSHNVYIKLFEQLKQSVELESTYETEARTRNFDDDERNRTQADIPGDAHRIRLFLDKGSDESDYINAVYLNSFKRLGYFIIAQSPLPNTLDDFVSMLYQENCCCIVSLDDYQQKGTNNAAYLPAAENQHATYGTCTISSTTLDSKPAYSVRKLKIGHSSRYEKGIKVAHHFEYTGWKHDERIPKDVNMFVEFVQEVEEFATQLADEHSHVLVHCLTGSGRSGLFCAVSNLIQKMGQDRQVSVVNTLRQVRARRKTAIRNTEQLKFCYQAVYAYVKNYQV